MSEQNHDEARQRKFQERLERISRRRFVQTAALGGFGASLSSHVYAQVERQGSSHADAMAPANPNKPLPFIELSSADILQAMKTAKHIGAQCASTRTAVDDFKVKDLFRADRTFYDILNNTPVPSDPTQAQARNNLLNAFSGQNVTIHTLYSQPYTTWTGTMTTNEALARACGHAFSHFILPFFPVSQQQRAMASGIINNTLPMHGDKFIARFGELTVGQMMSLPMTKLDAWDAHLIGLAKRSGLITLAENWRDNWPIQDPPVPADDATTSESDLEKGKCLIRVGITWACVNGNESSQCYVNPSTNEPAAGSDLCQS